MKNILQEKIGETIIELQTSGVFGSFVLPDIFVERPKDDRFGEYTTNIALTLARLAKKNPMDIAQILVDTLQKTEKIDMQEIEKIDIVAPGYINFYFSQKVFSRIIETIQIKQQQYGSNEKGKNRKINNEFISANPTGPLSVGNGRGGFYADTLSLVLRKSGYEVVNEYYINDGGGQVMKLGHSVLKDAEAVYGGEYIDTIITLLPSNYREYSVREVGEMSAEIVMNQMIKKTIQEKMNIHFDQFISEKKDIILPGYVDKAIQILKEKGLTYESEGALFLRTTQFGDDKDRVLIKKDGEKAYFSGDCGYLLHKMERGFSTLIFSLGADHHGYINRLRAVAQALGFTQEIRFIISQMVRVVKDGKEVRMSKRAGNVVTIDDLVDTVGYDVARFFTLLYTPDTHMNFDLGLAQEHSQKNPVFYVQYAYARLCSIVRKASLSGLENQKGNLNLLIHPKEHNLIRELFFFPELVDMMAQDSSVHKLPHYAIKLADMFHSFYNDCVVVDEKNPALSVARLELVRATQVVLGETLRLMNIHAPEKM